jgi:hypothetical protein
MESGNGASSSALITPSGHFVAFNSSATDLVANDANGSYETFVRDRWARTTTLVSVNPSGTPGNGFSFPQAITPNGRFVIFDGGASNLVANDTNGSSDVFVRDLK